MSFPRYLEYKDSGVAWLGDVPKHWEVDRLKRSTVSTKNGVWGDDAKQDAYDMPCVRVADFDRKGLRVQLDEPTMRNIVDSERVGRVLVQGDLLLEKSGGGEGQPVGCVVLYDDPRQAVCSNFVARVQIAPGMESSFWRYVHAAAYAVRLNTRSIKQTSGIQNLDASQYFDERAGFPPLLEQTQIATFLDRETAKIDALVAEQRRLMALLKEKRQAVISHAVTKGLNPAAPMKPSGIEWLGDVPAHWEVGPLKRFWSVTDCKHVTAEFVDDGFPLASIREVQSRWVALENAKCTTEHFYEVLVEGNRQPLAGDLIFSRNATVGEVAQVHADHPRFAMGQDVVLLRKLSPNYSSDYLQHVIRSPIIILQLANMMIGSTFKRINVEEIRSFLIPSPPPTEQAEIANFLEGEVAKFDNLTAEAQRAIDLLQERRTALISAAVTGQIDVRGAV